MRCLACAAEMHLMHVVHDDTMPVPGYEHKTFMCSACGDVERRLGFTRHVGPSHTEPASAHATPLISPAPTRDNERNAGSGILRRLFAKLRGVRHSARASRPASVYSAPPASLRPAEPVPVPASAHSSAPSEASNDVDGLEALLRRAIEISRDPTPRSQPTESLANGSGTPAEFARPVPVHSSTPSSVSSEPRKDLDECDAVPGHAIEMDEAPTRSSEPATSLAEARPETAAELAGSLLTERSPRSHVAVRIHYDPKKAKYAAKDTGSGLGVLRHQDSARLRAMCDRMGWQVIDDADWR